MCLVLFAGSSGTAAAQNYQTTDIQDLALIYQGGKHRLDWTVDEFRPYVVHRFLDGSKHWLFDGFLFLEFKNGTGRCYTVGYEKEFARKPEWEWLLDRIFDEGKSLSALDRCIGEQIAEIGKPAFRHKVVLGLPEAVRDQKDWGELDGRRMDFSKDEDQIAATKWYIDQLIARFKKAGYKHLELSGFYWVAEDTNHCGDLTVPLSEYIHAQKKLFYWIPYCRPKATRTGNAWDSTWLISSPTTSSTSRSPTAAWTKPAPSPAKTAWRWSSNSTSGLPLPPPIRSMTGCWPISTGSKRTMSSTHRP